MLIYLRAYRTTSSICRCRRVGRRLSIVKSSSQTSDFQTNSSTSSDKRTDEEYERQGTYEKTNIVDEDLIGIESNSFPVSADEAVSNTQEVANVIKNDYSSKKKFPKVEENGLLMDATQRKGAALFAPFFVDYGNFGFGNPDIEENFMSKIGESPLMSVLVQAAPFGIVNTGPLGFNYFALKASGPNNNGWEINNLEKNYAREVIHGRWAMLAVCGAIVQEDIGKGPWFTGGQVCTLQTCGTFSYGTLDVGFSSTWAGDGPGAFFTIYLLQLLLIWQVECYRTGVTSFDGVRTRSASGDAEEDGKISTIFSEFQVGDVYPGGRFDPLNFAKSGEVAASTGDIYKFASSTRLKAQELRHGRLAMLAWLGFLAQSVITNEVKWPPNTINNEISNGPLDNLQTFISNLQSCPIDESIGIPGC